MLTSTGVTDKRSVFLSTFTPAHKPICHRTHRIELDAASTHKQTCKIPKRTIKGDKSHKSLGKITKIYVYHRGFWALGKGKIPQHSSLLSVLCIVLYCNIWFGKTKDLSYYIV